MRRAYGSGSISWREDRQRWQAVFSRRGRRSYRYFRTIEEAERRLTDLASNTERGKTDGLRAHTRRRRAEAWIGQVLALSVSEGWTDAFTARVIVAQLSPRRIKRDIFGPCAYCGTWIAATVDHVIPTAAGGSDDPANLASACWSCNSRKGDRPLRVMATVIATSEVSVA